MPNSGELQIINDPDSNELLRMIMDKFSHRC